MSTEIINLSFFFLILKRKSITKKIKLKGLNIMNKNSKMMIKECHIKLG